jgi:hypothetical protein
MALYGVVWRCMALYSVVPRHPSVLFTAEQLLVLIAPLQQTTTAPLLLIDRFARWLCGSAVGCCMMRSSLFAVVVVALAVLSTSAFVRCDTEATATEDTPVATPTATPTPLVVPIIAPAKELPKRFNFVEGEPGTRVFHGAYLMPTKAGKFTVNINVPRRVWAGQRHW